MSGDLIVTRLTRLKSGQEKSDHDIDMPSGWTNKLRSTNGPPGQERCLDVTRNPNKA